MDALLKAIVSKVCEGF